MSAEEAKNQLMVLEELEKIDRLHLMYGSPSDPDVTQRVTNALLHSAGAKPSAVLKKLTEIALGDQPTKVVRNGDGHIVSEVHDANVQLNALNKVMDLMGIEPVKNDSVELNQSYEEQVVRVVSVVGIEDDEG